MAGRAARLETALAPLPDEAQVPVGWVRAQLYPEQDPAVADEVERTVRMWEDRATRNLCRPTWDQKPGATP
jgi:hypothetical protein